MARINENGDDLGIIGIVVPGASQVANFSGFQAVFERRTFMSDEKKDKAPIDFSHIGGIKVGHPVPVRTEKPIDFSSIGGKCVRKLGEHPTAVKENKASEHRNDQ
jgi:hypothetical protein